MKDWAISDVPDLKVKVIIVTGGNSGIGFETVKFYASKGAKIVMACRSVERAKTAYDIIVKENDNADVEIMELDLASLDSIKSFAAQFKTKHNRLDILLNNAGVMTTPYGKTVDGFEQQFGINHFGHFALTGLLFDTIKATPNSRIVNISSMIHKAGKINFDNLMFEDGKNYKPMRAYAQSKLANLLYTYELQRKLDAAKLNIKVLAAHPGVAATSLGRHLENKWYFKMFGKLFMLLVHSNFEAALPGIRASLDPQAMGSMYFGPKSKSGMRGMPVKIQSSAASHDENTAQKLWKVSKNLTGVEYNFSK